MRIFIIFLAIQQAFTVYDSVDNPSIVFLNTQLQLAQYCKYESTPSQALEHPKRGLDDLDAVPSSRILTRGECRPDIARRYVLFREPNWVLFFGCILIQGIYCPTIWGKGQD
jgi:hypothetical protein